MPYFCWKPLMTRRALKRTMLPAASRLRTKTHRQCRTLRLCGRGTRVHVLLCMSEWYSERAAACQSDACGDPIASL
eukprot:jgi/Phyca11/128350/e_gw1.75.160.1